MEDQAGDFVDAGLRPCAKGHHTFVTGRCSSASPALLLKNPSQKIRARTAQGNPVSLCRIAWVLAEGSEINLHKETAQGPHKDRRKSQTCSGPWAIHLDRDVRTERKRHASGTHKDTHMDFETSACVLKFPETSGPSQITQDHAQGTGTRAHTQGPHIAKCLHKDPHKEICTRTFLDISLCNMILCSNNTIYMLCFFIFFLLGVGGILSFWKSF